MLLLEALIPIPARYPDLFPVLNVLLSTPVFVLIWLWSIKCGVEVGWAVAGGWGQRKKGSAPGSKDGQTVATASAPAVDGMPS